MHRTEHIDSEDGEDDNVDGYEGEPFKAWKYWMPDHRRLLSSLRRFTALKKLVFSNDAYESGYDEQEDEEYYYRSRIIVESEFEMALQADIAHPPSSNDAAES